jgi:hypothetical protein
MYVIRYRLCFLFEIVCRLFFLLQTEYRLCFLSSSDGRDDFSKPIATMESSRDGWMMSPHLLLLGAIVVTVIFCPLLIKCCYSGSSVSTDRLPMTTVTYDSLLQCHIFVIVQRASCASTKDPIGVATSKVVYWI